MMSLRQTVLSSLRVLLCFLVLIQCISCQSMSIERVCEPGLQTGCASDQMCTVDKEGRPLCLPISIDPIPLGAPCQRSDDCQEGAGCLMYLGRPQCRAFCSIESNQTAGNLTCIERLGVGSECSLALFEREEIGVCTAPCDLRPYEVNIDLDSERMCPEGLSCSLPLGEPQASCVIPGEQRRGERCSLEEKCDDGLSCILEGGFARCERVSVGVQDCGNGEVNRALRWARDPFTGDSYTACLSYLRLDAGPLEGFDYYLDLTLNSGEELLNRCIQMSGGRERIAEGSMLTAVPQELDDILVELSLMFSEAQLSESGVWVVPDGALGSLDGRGEPIQCERLDLTSRTIEPTPCDLPLPSLCALEPQSL